MTVTMTTITIIIIIKIQSKSPYIVGGLPPLTSRLCWVSFCCFIVNKPPCSHCSHVWRGNVHNAFISSGCCDPTPKTCIHEGTWRRYWWQEQEWRDSWDISWTSSSRVQRNRLSLSQLRLLTTSQFAGGVLEPPDPLDARLHGVQTPEHLDVSRLAEALQQGLEHRARNAEVQVRVGDVGRTVPRVTGDDAWNSDMRKVRF